MIKSITIKWVVYVARMGEARNAYKISDGETWRTQELMGLYYYNIS